MAVYNVIMSSFKTIKASSSKWLVAIILTGILWPAVAYQAVPPAIPTPFVPCNPKPSSTYIDGEWVPMIADQCTFEQLLSLPVMIYNWLIGTAAALAIAVMIWGGLRFIMHYTSDSPETELNNAKLTIRRGIVGLMIVAFSYFIVYFLVYEVFGVSWGAAPILTGFFNLFGL